VPVTARLRVDLGNYLNNGGKMKICILVLAVLIVAVVPVSVSADNYRPATYYSYELNESTLQSYTANYRSHDFGFSVDSGFVMVYLEAFDPGEITIKIRSTTNNEDKNQFSFGIGGGQGATRVARAFQVYGGSYSFTADYRTAVYGYGEITPWTIKITHVPDYLDYLSDWHTPGYDYHRLSNRDKIKADIYSPPSCCGYNNACVSCATRGRPIMVYPDPGWQDAPVASPAAPDPVALPDPVTEIVIEKRDIPPLSEFTTSKVWTDTNSYIVGASGAPIIIANNSSAADPDWNQLLEFIGNDPTDTKSYLPGSFVCADFAEMLHNNAEKNGIRAAYVTLAFDYPASGHACNAFQTTDRGLVYIDCTRYIGAGPANSDRIVDALKVGAEYRSRFLFPEQGWSSWSNGMGKVSTIKIQW
jgi:hypothetical protein